MRLWDWLWDLECKGLQISTKFAEVCRRGLGLLRKGLHQITRAKCWYSRGWGFYRIIIVALGKFPPIQDSILAHTSDCLALKVRRLS